MSAALNWQDAEQVGAAIHALATKLYPLNRSLTGPGVRQSLSMLQELLPELVVSAVPTGYQAFDWTVPDEWQLEYGYLQGPDGEVIVDSRWHNLHVLGYSEPIDQYLSLEELQPHLYSRPDLPTAIPYVTSYYQRRWGFCLSQQQRDQLKPGQYRAVIKSRLAPGQLNYGELLLAGESTDEVLLSSYICHPSMANNELSGPCVASYLMAWLASLPKRRYSYRLILVPETLGALVYLSKHLPHLQRHTLAGFNLSCIGDERTYSYLPSRAEDTLADRMALHVLQHYAPDFKRYSYLERGSNERQLCAPGVDLPVATVMRSKYGCYPEYHTSLDDLSLITPKGLGGGFAVMQRILAGLEANQRLRVKVLGEPQLGKRGLYPTLCTHTSGYQVRDMMNLIAYADGSRDLLQIAEKIAIPIWRAAELAEPLLAADLLEVI